MLTKEERKELLKIARESIELYLKEGKKKEFKVSEELKEFRGAFVTLRKNHELRGCIGFLEPKFSLWKVVQEVAISSALEDARFSSVTLEEMKEIKIEISVLSPLKKIKNPLKEIELEKHGVIIKKGYYSGVFLPQVAKETGWNLEEFLNNLCEQKIGLDKNCWREKDTEIFIFTCEIVEE